MTVSISSLLSATLAANTQNQNKVVLNQINNTLTTRLNNRIAKLEAQSSDTTTVQLLQSQLNAANTQNSAFTQASTQWLANEKTLSDLTTQLTALNTAAQNGDGTAFDSALGLAQLDLANLNVVSFVPGTQPDGVVNLKLSGLGIQSSTTYDLSTANGQAQAESDIAKTQTVVSQITTVTLQNQVIATSASNGFQAQIADLTRRLGEISDNQNTTVQAQISKLQQQEQFEFHVIELGLQNTGNANGILTSGASSLATTLASQPGSRTAPKTNPFIDALKAAVGIANKLNATRLGGAATQPDSTTAQANSANQAATGSLLNLFS